MRPLVFMHIIKTGGSTIAQHLNEHLDGFSDSDLHRRPRNGAPVRFIGGHDVYPGKFDGRLMTIWREPAAWLVSGYNHARARGYGSGFLEWYETGARDAVNLAGGRRNKMVEWCRRYWRLGSGGVDEILGILDRCELVGLTEDLDVNLPALFRHLEVPEEYERRRVSGEYDPEDGTDIPRYELEDEELRRRIRRENPLDYQIYEYVKEEKKLWSSKLV